MGNIQLCARQNTDLRLMKEQKDTRWPRVFHKDQYSHIWNIMYDEELRTKLPEGCQLIGIADDLALVAVIS